LKILKFGFVFRFLSGSVPVGKDIFVFQVNRVSFRLFLKIPLVFLEIDFWIRFFTFAGWR